MLLWSSWWQIGRFVVDIQSGSNYWNEKIVEIYSRQKILTYKYLWYAGVSWASLFINTLRISNVFIVQRILKYSSNCVLSVYCWATCHEECSARKIISIWALSLTPPTHIRSDKCTCVCTLGGEGTSLRIQTDLLRILG